MESSVIFTAIIGICGLFILLFSRGEYYFLEALGIIFISLSLLFILLHFVFQKLAKIKINNKLIHHLIFLATFSLGSFILLFVTTFTWIGNDVKTQCQAAKWQYGGNCPDALISLLNDENQSFRSRNSAIWALGQLGDNRALPVLQSYYTGNIPDREPLNGVISQYELKKAINLTGGGINITAIFWRHGID